MSSVFSTNLLILRKQKGVSQKEVANDLEISQALLSHYEKGIRECGLDFVVKVSEYYDVSSDFLLGIKEIDTNKNTSKTNVEKMILNSINIIFVILKKINSKKLIYEVSNYLSTSVYTILRYITRPNEYFDVDEDIYSVLASSNMSMSKAKVKMIIKDEELNDKLPKLLQNKKTEELKKLVNFAEEKMKEDS